jgi:Flp pilus assembly protein TadD
LHFRLAQASSAAKDSRRALAAVEKAVALDPKNIEYLRACGQIANWNGKPEMAAKSYERILALSPNDQSALLNLARSQAWAGRVDPKNIANIMNEIPKTAGSD